ncbi:diaminopimelate decarboxylase [Halococcus hamelinensis]|uniref:Diaminopimelate decarboxylase n=1 Tax=Halococcus hamelinensis 100A6 TaxID=1132509 RepID=M0LSV6_9EURY|nr:diaminopimelate decarboxylase [Halococcus hamelinensis]EMA35479.1 diaminopimelate decarboxylase [Halococcus hamelinensis 100A6]
MAGAVADLDGNPAVRRLGDWSAARLRDLAADHGTPLYVVDLGRVRENAARLRAAFPDAAIDYAVKANARKPVLETLAEEGLGAECASAGEVVRAYEAGVSTLRYTAVNPPARDLDRVVEIAAEREVTITVGARDTLTRLADRDWTGRVYLRANPAVGAGHHEKVRTGGDPTFGIPAERIEAVAADAEGMGFDLVGLHAHAGSGILGDLSGHAALVERVSEIAADLADHDIDAVSIGGGFGVPYHETDPPLDLGALAEATRDAFGADARLGIEPGRYLVADAGVLLARVNTVKPTPETTVVGVDAGMTALARPALYDAYHAIRSLAADASERGTVATTVAGPVCESSDTLARGRSLPVPERGDLLAVGNAGAYGYEMASTYNSRPRPAVCALDGDESWVCVRRETVDDLSRLDQ